MRVRVRLFGTFREMLPAAARDGLWEVDVEAGTTASRLLSQLNIPVEDGHGTVVLVNGRLGQPDQALNEGDTLSAFPAMAGG